MASLLALQFAEPLPKVVARAQKTAKTMKVSEAMATAGHRMPEEVQALLQTRNSSAAEINLKAQSAANSNDQSSRQLLAARGQSRMGDAVLTKAMAFINGEYMIVREKIDLKLLECGFFKLTKEKMLYETQDKLDEIAMDMGLAEATMEACQGEIQKQTEILAKLSAELAELTRQCKITHDELAAEKALVEEDLRVINLILNVTREECVKMGVKVSAASASLLTVHACLGRDGKTYFDTGSSLLQDQAGKFKTVSSQQAYQRALFEVYGMDSPLPGKVNLKLLDDFDDDDTDDFPEGLQEAVKSEQALIQVDTQAAPGEAPTGGTPKAASYKDLRERCPMSSKPNCRKIP